MDHESALRVADPHDGPPVTGEADAPLRPDRAPQTDRRTDRPTMLRRGPTLLARVPGLAVLGGVALNYLRHASANTARAVDFTARRSHVTSLAFLSAGGTLPGGHGPLTV